MLLHPEHGRQRYTVADVVEAVGRALGAQPKPPQADIVVLGGDFNSFGPDVACMRTPANPQFVYATSEKMCGSRPIFSAREPVSLGSEH